MESALYLHCTRAHIPTAHHPRMAKEEETLSSSPQTLIKN